MWKWLILALAVYALYRLFANDFLKKKKAGDAEDAAEMERQVAAGEMVRDPECGTYVAVDSAISVRDGEKVHYFCSYECRDKFLKRLEEGGRVLPPRHEE
ncbi:MAG: transcriptional regulator [Desulfovibrio sp.]|nr:transcriptional regulator [Desulfovibrio sp.]